MVTLTGYVALAVVILGATTASADALFQDYHVVKKPKADHGYRGIMGDFLQLKDGSILMAYTDGDIMVIRSTDEGVTWGEPSVLVPRPKPPAKGHIGAPSFLRLEGGDILLTYYHSTHPATPYYANNYYRRSSDEGQTWSEQFCYTPLAGYVLVHNDRLHLLSTCPARATTAAMLECRFSPTTAGIAGSQVRIPWTCTRSIRWRCKRRMRWS